MREEVREYADALGISWQDAEDIADIGYQAGRNHSIEISLEEAARAIARYIYRSQGLETMNYPSEDAFVKASYTHYLDEAAQVLSLVPNCVIKE